MPPVAVGPLVLAAHGTRSATGLRTVRSVVAALRARRGDVVVLESYLDVASPSLDDVVRHLDGPAVVVPFLLSGGYHVRHDIPAVLAGRPDVAATAPLGPDPALAFALADRLAAARGERPAASAVVLAWAGSSDPDARDDAARAAGLLAEHLAVPVRPVALSGPDRVTAVGPDVEVATYLLSAGEFADRAAALGAPVTAAPLGDHPAVVDLVLARYEAAAAVPLDSSRSARSTGGTAR